MHYQNGAREERITPFEYVDMSLCTSMTTALIYSSVTLFAACKPHADEQRLTDGSHGNGIFSDYVVIRT